MDTKVDITRVFRASREVVFDAIASGLLFEHTGSNKDTHTIDFRVGGTYQTDWGDNRQGRGEFKEIDPPNRVVFTWNTFNCEFNVEGTLVTIELSDHPEGCELRLTHDNLVIPGSYDDHLAGWTGCLKRLGEDLSQRRSA